MLANKALREAVKSSVAPALRDAGFRGTYPTWRYERDGDVAVVNIRGDKFNEDTYGRFLVNIAMVPSAWWAWSHECARDHPVLGSTSQEGKAQEWDGMYRSIVAPTTKRGDEHWEVRSTTDAATVATLMTEALLEDGLPRLMDLMGTARTLQAVRSGRMDGHSFVDDRFGGRDLMLAVLLSQVGGYELDEVCRRLDALPGRASSDLAHRTATWARERALRIHAANTPN